jgi:archaellum component FlaG (FlaF/FlaG flagellin family)
MEKEKNDKELQNFTDKTYKCHKTIKVINKLSTGLGTVQEKAYTFNKATTIWNSLVNVLKRHAHANDDIMVLIDGNVDPKNRVNVLSWRLCLYLSLHFANQHM